MRVLVVAAWPPWPRTDGASLILAHQLRLLATRHEVTVLAAGRPPGARQPSNDETGMPADLLIRWVGPPRAGLREYSRRRWASVRTREPADVSRVDVRVLQDAIREALASDPDVVHLHGWGTAALVAHLGGKPAVHMAVDAWHAGAGALQQAPWWRRAVELGQPRKIRSHEARWYPRCEAVIVVGPRDAEAVQALAPSARVEVIPNGVEAGAPPAAVGNEPRIGFHGTLSTLANITAATTLADVVLPLVQRELPEACALLVGRDAPPSVTKLARADVELAASVPEVRPHLERMAVYVAAMTNGTGIKNKVLEAMAAGRPIVATPLALNGIGDGGGVLVADNASGLAEATVRLLRDPALRARLGAEARERAVRDFSWEASVEKVERLWEEAARGS